MHLLTTSAFCLAILSGGAFAAASDSDSPPATTKTTAQCTNGKVWDTSSKSCVTPKNSSLSDESLYQAARELAYDGQYHQALTVLDAMPDQADDRVLTYRGFAHRKMGQTTVAMEWYRKALDRNPDNLLARSYMGQGLLMDGDLLGARSQLLEIRARGGKGSWPELALLKTIETGTAPNY